jgi:hypothetical protein
MADDRPKSLNPKPAPKGKSNMTACPMCGNVTSAPSMMERFQNFVTGGASGTMKKAGKPKTVGDALSQ